MFKAIVVALYSEKSLDLLLQCSVRDLMSSHNLVSVLALLLNIRLFLSSQMDEREVAIVLNKMDPFLFFFFVDVAYVFTKISYACVVMLSIE